MTINPIIFEIPPLISIIPHKQRKYIYKIKIVKDSKKMTENEKKLLVELICNEQTHMIIKDHTSYDSDKYKELEALKIKIKDM